MKRASSQDYTLGGWAELLKAQTQLQSLGEQFCPHHPHCFVGTQPAKAISVADLSLAVAMSVISLAGKTALVTGSTSGIGWEVLKALAGAGANVAMHGLGDPAKLSDMRSKLASDTGVKVGSPEDLVATANYTHQSRNCGGRQPAARFIVRDVQLQAMHDKGNRPGHGLSTSQLSEAMFHLIARL